MKMITEEYQKAKDGGCIDHKFSEPKFDCETKEGKAFPRWSIKCQRCGHKEYRSLLDVDYVAVPIVIFSERSFRL